jgi:hypothetical protein
LLVSAKGIETIESMKSKLNTPKLWLFNMH